MRTAQELAGMVRQRDGVIADAARTRGFLDAKIERLERELAEARRELNDIGACCRDMIDRQRDHPEMVSIDKRWHHEFGLVMEEILYGDAPVEPAEAIARLAIEWEKGHADLVPYQDLSV